MGHYTGHLDPSDGGMPLTGDTPPSPFATRSTHMPRWRLDAPRMWNVPDTKIDPRTRPQIMDVVPGAQEPDYTTFTIGFGALRDGDHYRRQDDPPGCYQRHNKPVRIDHATAGIIVEAIVQPRPVRPELAVGVGVRWSTADGPPWNHGWLHKFWSDPKLARVLGVHGEPFDVPTSLLETVADDEMPPYQPPEGIEADRPPEVVQKFEIHHAHGTSVTHIVWDGMAELSPEIHAWLARFHEARARQ